MIRPGRLDRLIHVPLPDKDGRMQIFNIHSSRMNFSSNINRTDVIGRMDGFSGAEIHATCTEAGYFAIRENRIQVTKDDFLKAIVKVRQEGKLEGEDFIRMFG